MLSRRTAVPMLDLLFLILCWVVLLVNPSKTDATKPIADYMLFIVWDIGRDTDLDVYVQGPDRKVAFFRMKDLGYLNIDRDDLGGMRDRGPINQEIVSFREPNGNFLISLHNYREEDPRPGKVAFELFSRSGQSVWQKTFDIPGVNQEIPVIELEFKDKHFVRSYPSNAFIRHSGGQEQ